MAYSNSSYGTAPYASTSALPQTVDVGGASETEQAETVSVDTFISIDVPDSSETESAGAQTVDSIESKHVSVADEFEETSGVGITSTVDAVGESESVNDVVVSIGVGTATETEEAGRLGVPADTAEETEESHGLSGIVLSVTGASENESAGQSTTEITTDIGGASETESTTLIDISQAYSIADVVENESSIDITANVITPVGIASETEETDDVVIDVTAPIGLVAESELVRPAGIQTTEVRVIDDLMLEIDPAGYWAMDATGGTFIENRANNYADGTLTGSYEQDKIPVSVWQTVIARTDDFRSIYFDASGGGMVAADSTINEDSHQGKTVVGFVDPDGTSNRQVLYKEGNQSDGIGIYIEDNSIYFGVWEGGTAHYISGEVTNDERVFYALRYNNGALDAYIDGTYISRVETGFGTHNAHASGAVSFMHNGAGGMQFHDGYSTDANYFVGRADNLAVYIKSLSDQEIRKIYRKGETGADLIPRTEPVTVSIPNDSAVVDSFDWQIVGA